MITPNNLAYHELIGLAVEVVQGGTSEGLKGKVIDETMSTIRIETGGKEKTIMKNTSKFMFTLPSGQKVLVDGNVILARPEDRIRKKVKKW